MSRTASRKVAKGEYIETDSGNKVSRRSHISGTANITLGGRTVIMADVYLRGDLHHLRYTTPAAPSADGSKPKPDQNAVPTSIVIGRCTVISTGSVIKPPCKTNRGVLQYYAMKIGDNVFIGPNSHISAISIGNHVHIGAGVIVHPFAIIRENVKVLPGAVIPAGMVVPSGSVVGGQPARIVGEVGEGWGAGAGLSSAGVIAGGGAGGGGGSGAGVSGGIGAGGGEKWVEGGDLRELVRAVR